MNLALWYVSRATGLVSLVLLTAVLVLGVVLSGRRRPHGGSATVVMALHRWWALGVSTFLVAHIVTAVVETYVDLGWISVLVPFTAGYEPLWVGLGTLAVDLVVAVGVTSYARHRLPERAWRAVHVLSYLLWPLAVVHGVAMGTADQPILRGVSIACGVVGAAAVAWRLSTTHHDDRRRSLVAARGWS